MALQLMSVASSGAPTQTFSQPRIPFVCSRCGSGPLPQSMGHFSQGEHEFTYCGCTLLSLLVATLRTA